MYLTIEQQFELLKAFVPNFAERTFHGLNSEGTLWADWDNHEFFLIKEGKVQKLP